MVVVAVASVQVFANQFWTLGAIPRVWLRAYDANVHAAVDNWQGLSLADQEAWLAYGRRVEKWPSWHVETETLAVVQRARPCPQVFGAASLFSLAAGGALPIAAPSSLVDPADDEVVITTSDELPAPPAPLQHHVWATWTRAGGWGGSPWGLSPWPAVVSVYLLLFARSTTPLLSSEAYWKTRGFGGFAAIGVGVPVLLDGLLVSCATSGSSPQAWLRVALSERNAIPILRKSANSGFMVFLNLLHLTTAPMPWRPGVAMIWKLMGWSRLRMFHMVSTPRSPAMSCRAIMPPCLTYGPYWYRSQCTPFWLWSASMKRKSSSAVPSCRPKIIRAIFS